MSHKFLLVIALSSKNVPYWVSYCRAHALSMIVNLYDSHAEFPCETSKTYHVAGSKALFWKALSDTSIFKYVWFMDEDIRYYDASFASIDRIMTLTNASILQPHVVPVNHGKFNILMDPNFPCLVHTTSFVEVQAPLFTSHAWSLFRNDVVRRVPDSVLRHSDWLDSFWCKFVEDRLNSTCIFSRSTVVKHLDMKTFKSNRSMRTMHYHAISPNVRNYIRFPGRQEKHVRCFDERYDASRQIKILKNSQDKIRKRTLQIT